MTAGLILVAVGLAILAEGVVWALAPGLIDRLLVALQSLPLAERRSAGLIAMGLGAVIVWMGIGLTRTG